MSTDKKKAKSVRIYIIILDNIPRVACYTLSMKRLLVSLFLLLVFASSPIVISAQDTTARYAECDVCGYCQGKQTPGNWESCRTCLYPGTVGSPATQNKTLRINDTPGNNFNQQVTPYPGRYYTQIGCLSTDLGDFRNPAAAGGITNQILNKLIFPAVGGLAFFYLIYGAFLIATAQGEPDKLNQGKQVATGAVIGLIFVLSTIFIVNFIANGIIKIPNFSSNSTDRGLIQGRVIRNDWASTSLGTTATITIDGVGEYKQITQGGQIYSTGGNLRCGGRYTVRIQTNPNVKTYYAQCPNKIVPNNLTECPFVEGNTVTVDVPTTLADISTNNPRCYVDLYWKIGP